MQEISSTLQAPIPDSRLPRTATTLHLRTVNRCRKSPSATHYTGSMIRILRPLPVDSLKLLVFDLDGTLIDSAQDLCNSVNATLSHFDRDPLADPMIASFVGRSEEHTS